MQHFIPTSKKEIDSLGWHYVDAIIFSGDAFVDHPSFGTAVIARILIAAGYKVAVVPQPNWRDDLRDFKKLGIPRLFFGVTSGAMDSMVNHYTANKRLRSDDAYTPEGKSGYRPDYATSVYSNILKELYPDVPVVIGGIEASLRRLTHYDYWQNKLLPSILISSKADYLVYGMGERPILELAKAIKKNKPKDEIIKIPQLAYVLPKAEYRKNEEDVVLGSFEDCLKSKRVFVENFSAIELEANRMSPRHIIESYKDFDVHINPPFPPATEKEMDYYFGLPYSKKPHLRYKNKHIPAYEMIKHSINIHRGCFGGCSFCTIAAHQGRFIQSRSYNSIVTEINNLVKSEDFKGIITDVGAPTANMYGMSGKDIALCERCSKKSCLYPKLCPNLDHSHKKLLKLYSLIENIKGVKKFYIGSGIRYDLFLDEKGLFDETSYKYLKDLIVKHTSGRLKVAPEHTEDSVLKLMAKPKFSLFVSLRKEFENITRDNNLKYQLVPYFISSHPGCTMNDMKALSNNRDLSGLYMEQVQDFTPTPMTASSAMFYSGINLKDMKPIYIERGQESKKKQKSFFFQRR